MTLDLVLLAPFAAILAIIVIAPIVSMARRRYRVWRIRRRARMWRWRP